MVIALVWLSPSLHAQAYVSATGTFSSNSGQFYDFNFDTLGQSSTPITFRTWSYNGGTNAAGQSIGSAGFDSKLTLFNGVNTSIGFNDDLSGTDRNSLISATGVDTGQGTFIPSLAADNYRLRLENFSSTIGNGLWAMDMVSSGTTSFTFNSGTPSSSAQLSTLVFGSTNPAVPMVAQLGSTGPAVTNALTFASGSVGTISSSGYSAPQINVQAGATLNFSSSYFLQGQTLSVSGGAVNWPSDVQVTNNGTVSQSSGVVSIRAFFLGGAGAGTTVTYNLSGGTLVASQGTDFANISGSTITFNLSGGTWNANGGVVLGGLATGGTCYLNVSGGSLTTPGMTINSQPGLNSTVTQTGGTVNVAGQLGFQTLGGGNTLYTLNNGTLIANSINFFGSGGSATLLFQRGYLGITNFYAVSDTGVLGGAPVVGPLQTLAVTNGTDIPDFHALTLDGGTLSTGFFSVSNSGAFNFNSGTLIVTRNSGYVQGGGLPFAPLPNALVLNSNQTFTVTNQLSMAFVPGVSITVAGGQLNAGTLLAQGPVTVNAGQMNVGTFISTVGPFTITGGSVNIGSMNIEGSGPNVLVTGGQLQAGSIELDGAMSVNGGVVFTFNNFLDNGQLAIGPNGIVNPVGSMTINGSVLLGGGNAQIGAFSTISLGTAGFVQGSGVLFSGGVINNGTVRATSGDTLRIGVGTLTNNHLVDLEGGLLTVEYGAVLANTSTGIVSGRGAIDAISGINNDGTIALSGGLSDVRGALTNNSGAKTIVTGGSTSTFYDNVTNSAGSEFRVATGSTAVFLGTVSGLSQFTGLGIKDFEGPASFGALDTPGSTLVGTGGALVAQHIREAGLEVDGVAQIALDGTNTGTSKVQSLTIPGSLNNWQGKLDLNDNDLIIDYTGASPLNTIANQIKSGRAGGAWNGTGITSSAAASTPHTALGYGEASVLGLSSFSGQSVDSTSVLVKYTYYGDADLDGDADGVDIGTWATNFTGELGGSGPKHWTDGDWDYDGDVDGVDAGLWAQAFTGELGGGGLGSVVVDDPTIAPAAAAILRGMGIAVIPEPAGVGLLLITISACRLRSSRRCI
jgi:hypothetical protein